MDFHAQALSETKALMDRMRTEREERSRQQFQAFRRTFDAAVKSIEASLATPASSEAEELVATLVNRLSESAAIQAQSSADRAKADAQVTIDAVRSTLSEQAGQNAQLTSTLESARSELQQLRKELESEAERVQAAEAEGALAIAGRDQAEGTLRETEALYQREAQARSAVEQQLEQVRHLLEAALSEVTASRKQLEKESVECKRLTAALATLGPQPFDALLATCQKLASATSIDDVLIGLVDALAGDFSRVALFRVDANHLKGVHQIGFQLDSDISKVVIPLTMDSLLSHAVSSGQVAGFAPAELPAGSRTPFGGSPTYILTLPVSVRGNTVAVIYGDDSSRAEPTTAERSLKFSQVLLWHAVPILTRLSTDLTTLTELRQYATMLVNEIGHIYNADAGAGKKPDELQSRLRDNLQCARQIFSQRVAPEGPFAATLLEEQLMLQAQANTAFGRDVGIVLGRLQQTRVLEAAS